MDKRARKVISVFILLMIAALACTCLPTGDGDETPPPPPVDEGTPPPPPPPSALFEDDFSDTGSGWEVGDYEGGGVGYEDGAYFVRAEVDGSVMWGVANRSFDNLIIDVDVTQVLAPANNNNAYGVKCREQSGGDGYGLMISGDGYYSIQVVIDGDWEELVEWTSSNTIHQGNTTNHIRAICDGDRLVLFVNGQLLAETEDSTYSGGDISFATSTLEGEPTEIHFDNLVVRKP